MSVIHEMENDITPEIRSTPTLIFSLSRTMIRYNIRGGYRLWGMLMKMGALNHAVCYTINGNIRPVEIYVPLYRNETSVSAIEVAAYEYKLVDKIVAIIKDINTPVRLIDCGADIGMVSALLYRNCNNIEQIDAFEPNAEAYQWLTKTLAGLSPNAIAHHKGVGNWNGQGSLIRPESNDSDHAVYVRPDSQGDIAVIKLDDYMTPDSRGVILKVDVEGGELSVIEGAENLLRKAPFFIVAFEAHYDVVSRTGQDPSLILQKLSHITDINVFVAELPNIKIDLNRNFFDQVPRNAGIAGKNILNIICASC